MWCFKIIILNLKYLFVQIGFKLIICTNLSSLQCILFIFFFNFYFIIKNLKRGCFRIYLNMWGQIVNSHPTWVTSPSPKICSTNTNPKFPTSIILKYIQNLMLINTNHAHPISLHTNFQIFFNIYDPI